MKAYCKEFFIIALDGPSGVGKSVLAKLLAEYYKLHVCQTGLFFRTIALKILENNVSLEDISTIVNIVKNITYEKIEDLIELHDEKVGNVASKIARLPDLRKKYHDLYSSLVYKYKKMIIEGRDIGTSLVPEADYKIYLTADVKVRAERRFKQLKEYGINCILETVLNDLVARDENDFLRQDSPLKIARDAFIINVTNYNEEEVFYIVIDYINRNCKN